MITAKFWGGGSSHTFESVERLGWCSLKEIGEEIKVKREQGSKLMVKKDKY